MINKNLTSFAKLAYFILILEFNIQIRNNMLRIYFIILLTFFISANKLIAQSENPFSEISDKEYFEYYIIIQNELNRATLLDSAGKWEQVEQFNQVAKSSRRDDLLLNARLFEHTTLFRQSRKGGLTPSSYYSAERFIQDLFSVSEDAEKKNIPEIAAIAYFNIAETYRIYLNDFDHAFTNYRSCEVILDKLDSHHFPLKEHYFLEIGNFYLTFGDINGALPYFEKAVKVLPSVWNSWFTVKGALNGLSICYRESGELDKSDESLKQLLSKSKDEAEGNDMYETFKALASGGLGENNFLRGNYDQATTQLKSSMNVMVQYNDYIYAAGKALTLAEIALINNNTAKAGQYLNTAVEYIGKSHYKIIGKSTHANDYYRVSAKYYAHLRKPALTTIYIDSMLVAEKHSTESFNARNLLRLEQKMRSTEMISHEVALQYEQEQKALYRGILIIVLTGSALLLVMLFLLIFLYRKKRRAYSKLASKAEQWASQDKKVDPVENNGGVSPTDYKLVDMLHKLMTEEELYKNDKLSLEEAAQRLEVSRTILSKAIYCVTGKTFNLFVNDYRVKAAIRIIYDKRGTDFMVDDAYCMVGFSGRPSFYVAFKNSTGLTPVEFKNSIKNADKEASSSKGH